MEEKNLCQGKQGFLKCSQNTGNFAKIQGFLCAKVLNSWILKIKDIALFAVKFPNFFLRTNFPKSVLHLKHSEIIVIGTGKICSRTGNFFYRKHREFENRF